MKTLSLVSLCLLTAVSLSSCKRGFELETTTTIDQENADRTFVGANEQASWRLLLDDVDDNFSLENLNNPGSSTDNYTLNGSFSTNDAGWMELEINSDRDDEVDTDLIYAIEIGDHAIILKSFTNVDSEWIPMVATTDCPTSNLSGLSIMLNRPADTNLATVPWLTEFSYEDDDELLEYANGVALDADFSLQETFFQESDDCTDGYVQRSAGDQYLGDSATLVEIDDDDVAALGYTRAFSLPSFSLDSLEELDSLDYIGMVRDFGDEGDYRVTATCISGVCELVNSGSAVLQLTLLDSGLNYLNIDGVVLASIQDPTGAFADTRAVCMTHPDIDDSDDIQQFMMCSAQSLSDSAASLQIILSYFEEDE